MSASPQTDSNLLTAVISGSLAATIATTFTYPFEFYKTIQQLHKYSPTNPSPTIFNEGAYFKVGDIAKGLSSLVVGNSLKASTRFIVFNYASKFMSNDNGKTTAPRIVIAGMMSGIAESLWVIPFENIKTTIIQNTYLVSELNTNHKLAVNSINNYIPDHYRHIHKTLAHKAKPGLNLKPLNDYDFHSTEKITSPKDIAKVKYNKIPSQTFVTAVREIYETRGVRGFTQGSMVTLLRQSSISAVWFSVYNALRQIVSPHKTDLNKYVVFGIGAVSSCSVVVITQPIDVLKTKLQSKNGKILYRDSMTCAFRVIYEEGWKRLWCGAVPRLVKLSVSGGLTTLVYERASDILDAAIHQKPFAAS